MCDSVCALCRSSTARVFQYRDWSCQEGAEEDKCRHGACKACLRTCIREHRDGDAEGNFYWDVPCCAPGCTGKIPTPLVTDIEEAKMYPDLDLAISSLRFGQASKLLVNSGARSRCAHCSKDNVQILANPECGHAGCESCWVDSGEEQVTDSWESKRLRPSCLEPGCTCAMAELLRKHVAKQSSKVSDHDVRVKVELDRLKRAGVGLLRPSDPAEEGPLCLRCDTRQFGLLAHPKCQHAVCEDCWGSEAERQVVGCASRKALHGICCEPECCLELPRELWRHACSRTPAASVFLKEMDAEVSRLKKTASASLVWAPQLCDAGPVCSICQEQHLALVASGPCGHAMCEDCWGSWSATQLDHCRVAKQPALRCLAEGCREVTSPAVWVHSCTRNERVESLEKEFAWRRRLQSSTLYPACAQVDCPRAGCLGLGYLGGESVMCFVCEHQWSSTESVEPQDGSLQSLIDGEVVKQCPRCKEHIMKNGGCDHMTCRCKHEFWWTTLQPYHLGRGAPQTNAQPTR